MLSIIISCYDDDESTGIIEPFSLTIMVADTNGNNVNGADVTLFENLNDFISDTNGIANGVTRADGKYSLYIRRYI